MNKCINIVAFDIPSPPNYGGVMDIFYKIKSLKGQGVGVVLHAFLYGNKKVSDELKGLCKEVYVYDRKTGFIPQLSLLPYIVNSRKSAKLLVNLCKNDYPILFEGLHTTYHLSNPKLQSRLKLVRAHNIEHIYYFNLFRSEKKITKKLFFYIEYLRLKNYEKVLRCANHILAISKDDERNLSVNFKNVDFVYPFHANDTVDTSKKEDYILYHGNLSVPENIDAVNYLLENVFSKLNRTFIVAGLNPSKELVSNVSGFKNVTLIANPSPEKMNELKTRAFIHIVYSKTNAGMKLKLLDALFSGSHVLISNNMVDSDDLKEICEVVDSPEEIIERIETILVAKKAINYQKREEILSRLFLNKANAKKLIEMLS